MNYVLVFNKHIHYGNLYLSSTIITILKWSIKVRSIHDYDCNLKVLIIYFFI